ELAAGVTLASLPAGGGGRLLVVRDPEHRARLERRGHAHELHHWVIERLFGIGMSLQHTAAMSGQTAIGRRPEHDLAPLDEVIDDLRGYVVDLRAAEAPDQSRIE